MWDAMIIIGLLGTMVAVVGSIIMGIKRNPIWKKWLAGAGQPFLPDGITFYPHYNAAHYGNHCSKQADNYHCIPHS